MCWINSPPVEDVEFHAAAADAANARPAGGHGHHHSTVAFDDRHCPLSFFSDRQRRLVIRELPNHQMLGTFFLYTRQNVVQNNWRAWRGSPAKGAICGGKNPTPRVAHWTVLQLLRDDAKAF